MVGDARRAGGGAAELTAGLRAGYDAAAGDAPMVVSMVMLTAR
jgi:hypothetical protein